MDAPARWALQTFDVLGALQGGEDAAEPADQIAPDPAIIVILDKTLQASGSDTPNSHPLRPYGNTVLLSSDPKTVTAPRGAGLTEKPIALTEQLRGLWYHGSSERQAKLGELAEALLDAEPGAAA